MQHQVRRFLWLASMVMSLALLDQAIKYLVRQAIGPGADQHRIEVLGSAVALEYLENRGAAFGMFTQATALLAAIGVIALAVGAVIVWRTVESQPGVAVGTSLILAGALGNVIDRIVRGYVIDYIAIGRFWKFNLADSAVTIGVITVFVFLWRADTAAPSHLQDTTL
jgi:signal peptidase II